MDSVLYSWLGAAAIAPFVTLLSCWTLAVFRSYRSNWRLLDIFLYALTSLEVVSGLFSFGYAILGAIRPDLDTPCRFIIWGLTATRTFHLTTITSLLLDRALASKWPHTYRSSVRHSQVKYHIVVLAVISIFVGVTSVFARVPFSYNCSLHPLQWDLKFSAFLACVYGLLILTGIICCLAVQIHRFRSRNSYHTSWSRDSATSSGSAASCEESRDLEWAVVAGICWLSYLVNHGPFLVLNGLGMAVPTFWSEWLDNSVVWLRLTQGILVPCILLLADMPHRMALKSMLKQSGRLYKNLSDNGGFHLQIGENPKQIGYPFYPPYHAAPFPQRLRWSPNHLPSLQSLQPLDADTLRKGNYGSAGYTTLTSFPSTTASFSSAFSSCSSAGQSVTTNAVDDFVFRRPSVLALFEQPPVQNKPANKRCDTPTPFLESKSEDTCSCSSFEIQKPPATIEKIQSTNYKPYPKYQQKQTMKSKKDLKDNLFEKKSCKTLTVRKPDETYRNFSQVPSDNCQCDSADKVLERPKSTRDMINKNMINIILAYENNQSPSFSDNIDTCSDMSEVEVSDNSRNMEKSFEDRSSTSSSESSDADSVQSVIIRQKVDQSGRISQCDISRVEKKFVKGDKGFTSDSSESSVISEHRIRYSEYL